MIILTSYADDYTSPVFFIKPVFVTSPGKGGIANHFAMLYSNRKLYAEMYKSLRNLILRKTCSLLLVWELVYIQSQRLVSLLASSWERGCYTSTRWLYWGCKNKQTGLWKFSYQGFKKHVDREHDGEYVIPCEYLEHYSKFTSDSQLPTATTMLEPSKVWCSVVPGVSINDNSHQSLLWTFYCLCIVTIIIVTWHTVQL